MDQYCSHTLDILYNMERYLTTFHWTKEIFLEFRTLKAIRTEANCQVWDLREQIANQHAKEVRNNTAAKHQQKN